MKTFALLLVTAALVASRWVPHPENFAPFGAFALAAGLWIGWRSAVWIPLAALLVSDVALNLAAGYPAIYLPRMVDYGAFALIAGLGVLVRSRGVASKVAALIATPFVFFVLSNFGVWLFGRGLDGLPYAKSLAGLAECYAAGLPFLRGTVAGDWFFLAAMALLMAAIQNARPATSQQQASQ